MGECDGGRLMATTTPNFGWSVPTSTDYVKDGAVAIETLGDAIDASLVDLKGGTTGQVLSKNTNTDMDFTWVTPNDADAIQNSIVDAKGDLISATAADTPARLASSGVNGDILTVDTSTATGLKWAAPASAGGFTQIGTASLSGATTTISSIPSGYRQLYIVLSAFSTSGLAQPKLRFNSDASSIYYTQGGNRTEAAAGAPDVAGIDITASATSNVLVTVVDEYASSHYKPFVIRGALYSNSASAYVGWLGAGGYGSNTAITSVSFVAGGANTFDAGTITVYGVK